MQLNGNRIFLFILVFAAAICLPGLMHCKARNTPGDVGGPSGPVDPAAYELARKVWKGLSKTRNICGGFDYHPKGGMRTVYCHAKTFTSYTDIALLVGVPVFKSGPHSGSELNLNSPDYGHYNREFVQRLPDILLPGKKDSAFRAATQGLYDKYLWKLARIHYVTYRKWQRKPNIRRVELLAYQEYQRKQALGNNNDDDHHGKKYTEAFYERFYYFMDPRYTQPEPGKPVWRRGLSDGGYNGNVVKTAAAFWLRRYMDGSVYDFARGLKQLLETYDAEWLRKQGG